MLKEKWYRKESIQAALVGGIFLLLAAVAPAIFYMIEKTPVPNPGLHLPSPPGNGHLDSLLCCIKITQFKLKYTVNGVLWNSYSNETIKACEGDTLLLLKYEAILSINDSCEASKIAAEAYIKKPNIENPDPKDKFDYNDGRFTKGRPVSDLAINEMFLPVSSKKGWILQSGWNRLVIAFLEYSPKYPEGFVFEHIHFKISRN